MNNKKEIKLSIISVIILIIILIVVVVLFWSIYKISTKAESDGEAKTINEVSYPNNEKQDNEVIEEEETSDDIKKINGNLNNEGFTIQKGNNVYISNQVINSAECGIYEITKNNKTKLIEESDYIESINYSGGFLYFIEINRNQEGKFFQEIIKMKPDGNNRQVLAEIEANTFNNYYLVVSNDHVYYINADNKLECINTNGKNKKQISDEDISIFQIEGEKIYYSTTDSVFKRMNLDGDDVLIINRGIDNFQVVEDEVFYIDRKDHYLVKQQVYGYYEKSIVIEKNVRSFNINEDTIYYIEQNQDKITLNKLKINGQTENEIVELHTLNTPINVVGDWIYYTDIKKDSVYYYSIYRIRTDGKGREEINI